VARRPLTGVLLVGGASTRFGSPKALARLDGETLADRAWRLLAEACDEQVAVGRLDGLPFPTIDDARGESGPLGGIVSALSVARHDVAVVIPVDMPLLTVDALHALADACADVAVGPLGPLPAAVSTHVHPTLVEALARGELRLRSAFAKLRVVRVDLDDRVLINVNEPSDLEGLTT